jgi:hypothetical protein
MKSGLKSYSFKILRRNNSTPLNGDFYVSVASDCDAAPITRCSMR